MSPTVCASAFPLIDEVNGPPSMSVDGRYAAWLSSGNTVPQLVLFDLERQREHGRDDTQATRCRAFTWSNLPGVGLAVADGDGSENWTLYRVRVDQREWTPLGQPSATQMRIAGLSAQQPDKVLVAVNGRDPRFHDYDVISLRTRQRSRVLENPGYAAVYFDHTFRPRLVETVNADGSRDLWHGEPTRRKLFLHIGHEDALCVRFVQFSEDGKTVFFVMPDGPDGMRVVGMPCTVDEPLAEPDTVFAVREADITQVFFSPQTGRPDIVQVEGERKKCVPLVESLDASIRALRRQLGHEPVLLERRAHDRYWIVGTHQPEADARYFVYEPAKEGLWALSAAQPAQSPLPIACRATRVPLRDGQRAVTYLTQPTHAAPARRHDAAPPAVLLVHGGPWRRSRWEYSERRAWLAAQGFTVIEPKFRGSTGFGPAWVNAADHQWGGAMQEDLEDTLDWAVEQGLADPHRIALFGGSYGGYAVLQMAATSKRSFRCVVATSPLTDLVRFLEAPPAYWRTALPMLLRRVGDPVVVDQRNRLEAMSPVHHAAGFRCPVLMVHGGNDSRVSPEMATRMFMALARADKEALLAVFPDEGHEIVNASNRRAFYGLMADFLTRNALDGNGTHTVPEGTTMKLFHSPRAASRTG